MLFCGIHRYTISICDAVCQFNDGAKGRYNLYKQLEVNIGDNSRKGLLKQQKDRLQKAAAKVTVKYKRRRQMLRAMRKRKGNISDKSYIPGAFSDKVIPDIDYTDEPALNAPEVKITVVKDNDVTMITMMNATYESIYVYGFSFFKKLRLKI